MSIKVNANLVLQPGYRRISATFNAGRGRGGAIEKKMGHKDSSIFLPDAPKTFYCPHAIFLGWTDDEDNQVEAKFAPGDEYTLQGKNPTFYAVWGSAEGPDKLLYEIIYDFNDDSKEIKRIVEQNLTEHIVISEIPSKTGRNFLGWSLVPFESTNLLNAGDVISLTNDSKRVNLFAIFDDPVTPSAPYTVTFKAGNGEGEEFTLQTDNNGKLTLPEFPSTWTVPTDVTKVEFLQWCASIEPSSDTGVIQGFVGEEITVPHDYILYANYLLDIITYTFVPWDISADEDKIGDPSPVESHNPAQILYQRWPYGTIYGLPVDQWKFENYLFLGWVEENGTEFLEPTHPFCATKDTTYYSGHMRNA